MWEMEKRKYVAGIQRYQMGREISSVILCDFALGEPTLHFYTEASLSVPTSVKIQLNRFRE